MDYWPQESADAAATLGNGNVGYVSRYALGRDYHKVLRSRLQKLCDRIQDAVGPFGHRVFTDSAPVLEKALARNAGLGWIGKHTNLIDRNAGSYFFLGLPNRRHRRALSSRCTALHFLPHDRACRQHSGGISQGHRQSHLRLR
jgi:hypothetical protein